MESSAAGTILPDPTSLFQCHFSHHMAVAYTRALSPQACEPDVSGVVNGLSLFVESR